MVSFLFSFEPRRRSGKKERKEARLWLVIEKENILRREKRESGELPWVGQPKGS